MCSDTVPVLLTTLLVLAGCSAVPGGLPGAPPGESNIGTAVPDQEDAAAVAPNAVLGPTTFDRSADIEQFEHLNVTVTGVTFERVNGPSVEFDVDAQTIDLVRLHGTNATLVNSSQIPEGTYTSASIEIDEGIGTLESGETVDVRLPAGQLRIDEAFAVDGGESIEFVFDITVVGTDHDGEYVLAPVVSDTGGSNRVDRLADETLSEVDQTATGSTRKRATRDDGDGTSDGRGGIIGRGGGGDLSGGNGDVDIEFHGGTSPGETLLVSVARGNIPIVGATIEIGGETLRTNRYGTAAVKVPDDAKMLTVKVEHDGERATLVREYADRPAEGPDD